MLKKIIYIDSLSINQIWKHRTLINIYIDNIDQKYNIEYIKQ